MSDPTSCARAAVRHLLESPAIADWAAESAVGVSLLARGLDRTGFERPVTALRLFRGEASAPAALADAA